MTKANVLLVMPRTGYLWDEWATPPVGIAYVSSYLKSQGITVYNINMNLEEDTIFDVLEREIRAHDINILGTGELVINFDKLQEITSCARRIKPELIMWIGGGLVTNSPTEAMNLIPDADLGMIDEGEITSVEMIRLLEQKDFVIDDEMKSVPGLVGRKKGGYWFSEPRNPIKDLDSLPFPDWEGFRLQETCVKYAKGMDRIVSSVVSSRSCPNSCTFCSKSGGTNYRKRTLDNIFEEIDFLVNKLHVGRINFNDELFADSSDRLYQFCDRIEKYDIKYRVSMHVGRNLTLDLLKRMKQSGCEVIFYGLESADNGILKSMRKHTTIEEINRCLSITKKAGIIVEGCFIFGDPCETKDTVEKTLDWLKKNFYMGLFEVAPIRLYPGSQLFADAVESGRIRDTTSFVKEKIPLINVSKLDDESYEQLIEYDLTEIQKIKALPQKGTSIEYKNRELYGICTCSNCGYRMKYRIEDKSHILRMYTKLCDKCSSMEYINIFSVYYKKTSDRVKSLLNKTKVGVFGCGNVWRQFYAGGDVFCSENYTLIDETPYLQKNGWNGRKVYSPEIIKEKCIDTVISMVRSSKTEIVEKLNDDYGIADVDVIPCYEFLDLKV